MELPCLIFLSNFRKKISELETFFIFWGVFNPKPKTLLIFWEGNLKAWKNNYFTFFVCWGRTFQLQVQKKRISYTSLYKDAKFSGLKYFLIIVIKRFFSFYSLFFYTQQATIFHLLRDFCYVQDHIVALPLFLI